MSSQYCKGAITAQKTTQFSHGKNHIFFSKLCRWHPIATRRSTWRLANNPIVVDKKYCWPKLVPNLGDLILAGITQSVVQSFCRFLSKETPIFIVRITVGATKRSISSWFPHGFRVQRCFFPASIEFGAMYMRPTQAKCTPITTH